MTRAHIKWIKLALIVLFPFCGLTGCYTLGLPFRYWYDVYVYNDGEMDITVTPFNIAGRGTTINPGVIPPSGLRGIPPLGIAKFVGKPSRHVTIEWRNEKTGKRTKVPLTLKWPKEFNKKNANKIVLHIKPESEQVDISYFIQDPNTKEIYEYDQNTGQRRVIDRSF